MGIVSKQQIESFSGAAKALQKLESATSKDGDWLDKTERIVNGISDLVDRFNKTKNQQTPAAESERAMIDSSRRPAAQRELRAPEHQAQSDTNHKSEDVMNKMVKPILEKVSDFLDDCIAENPNMTIEDAIKKIPLNVMQVRGLLQVLKVLL